MFCIGQDYQSIMEVFLALLDIICSITTIYYYRKIKLKNKNVLLLSLILFTLGLLRLLPFHETINSIITILKSIFILLIMLYISKIIQSLSRTKTIEEYNLLLNQKQQIIDEHMKTLENVKQLNHNLANELQRIEYTIVLDKQIKTQHLKLKELKEIVINLRKEYKS